MSLEEISKGRIIDEAGVGVANFISQPGYWWSSLDYTSTVIDYLRTLDNNNEKSNFLHAIQNLKPTEIFYMAPLELNVSTVLSAIDKGHEWGQNTVTYLDNLPQGSDRDAAMEDIALCTPFQLALMNKFGISAETIKISEKQGHGWKGKQHPNLGDAQCALIETYTYSYISSVCRGLEGEERIQTANNTMLEIAGKNVADLKQLITNRSTGRV